MAGTLDFKQETIECSHCGEEITIDLTVDYDPKYQLNPTHVGISGGSFTCPLCGEEIHDDDL